MVGRGVSRVGRVVTEGGLGPPLPPGAGTPPPPLGGVLGLAPHPPERRRGRLGSLSVAGRGRAGHPGAAGRPGCRPAGEGVEPGGALESPGAAIARPGLTVALPHIWSGLVWPGSVWRPGQDQLMTEWKTNQSVLTASPGLHSLQPGSSQAGTVATDFKYLEVNQSVSLSRISSASDDSSIPSYVS